MKVEVGHRDLAHGRPGAGDRPDSDGAVAAQDEDRLLTVTKRIRHAARGAAHDLHDLVQVLGPGPDAVRMPWHDRRVPQVTRVEAHVTEQTDESHTSHRGRRLLLAHPARAGTRRHTDDG
jgi:hypothetical protein